MRAIFIMIAVLACPGPRAASAQTNAAPPDTASDRAPDGAVDRPDLARRVVRLFDFEEREINPLPVPRFWFRAQHDPSVGRDRPGFSVFNRAELDYGVARRGVGSVRLPTLGGSTALRLETGVVPIFADVDYMVTAYARTDGLRHAQAVLTTRFLDAAGRPVAGSESRSEPTRTEGSWRPVSAVLVGAFPDAAYIQIDLELLQPVSIGRPTAPPGHQVWDEDLAGAAWFDDVAVVQLPRIDISAADPAGVFVAPAAPQLRLVVRDLTGEPLSATLRVIDSSGRVADEVVAPVAAGDARWSWTPKLSGLGWYRAQLEVSSGPAPIGWAWTDFVWMPPAPGSADAAAGPRSIGGRSAFGIDVLDLPAGGADDVVRLIEASGVGAVVAPVWSSDLDGASIAGRTAAIGSLTRGLARRWVSVGFSLDRTPASISVPARLDADDPVGALRQDERRWAPLLDPILDRHGVSASAWQLGRAGDDRAFWDPDLAGTLASAAGALGRMVAAPRILVPWRADQTADPATIAAARKSGGLRLFIPASAAVEAIPTIAAAWSASPAGASGAEVVLETLPADLYLPRAVADDLVKRATLAWAGFRSADPSAGSGGVSISISQPWTLGPAPRRRVSPGPHLAAWRTVIDQLAGRRPVGEMHVAPGVRCLIFGPEPGDASGRGGALAVWLEGASEIDSAGFVLELGAGEIHAVDVFGNESPLPRAEGSVAAYRVTATPSPIFITGVDAELLRFLSALRLDPPLLRTDALQHDAALVVTNPWPVGLTGRVAIVEPGGIRPDGSRDRSWTISPRVIELFVDPGETARLPVTIAFSPSQESGKMALVLDLDVSAGRDYRAVRHAMPFEVGLDELEVLLGRRPTATGDGLVVEARVRNRGARSMTLELSAVLPGVSRASASIGELPPGAEVSRQFVFRIPPGLAPGSAVSVTTLDLETGGRLNRSIPVD